MIAKYTRTRKERNHLRDCISIGLTSHVEEFRTCLIARLVIKHGSKRIWRYATLADNVVKQTLNVKTK